MHYSMFHQRLIEKLEEEFPLKLRNNEFENKEEVEKDPKKKEAAKSVASKTKADDDVCFHYDGILLISYADKDGFATVFFLYILNQLLYAERHNLLPWIHLDSQTNTHRPILRFLYVIISKPKYPPIETPRVIRSS